MTYTVLVANRGEIAYRVIRACRQMGLRSVAVYSEADRNASYLHVADQAVCIGPAAASGSYLDIGAILMAAQATGANAIHPGYGFLSENARFAEAVESAGLVFVGPSSSVMRMMGDKIQAKLAMRASDVPCVAGSDGALPTDLQSCHLIAESVGYPVIIKASGGGGGRGMRVVHSSAELAPAIATTREEARRAFGNPEVYLERYLRAPRHVEIQVLCDNHGNAVWVGDRDCSVQRRHQKVIEEAPAFRIPRDEISSLGESCTAACRHIGYRGAGTFEFLYDDGVFAFIEMNTRIQVEHPVTEETTGIDLVMEQLHIAMGHRLSFTQSDVRMDGHSMECRVNAEGAFSGLPSPGKITRWHGPGGVGIRVDTHVESGSEVPPYYDSLFAKVIVRDKDRAGCIARMRSALRELKVDGIETNIELHLAILSDPAFVEGGASIHYLEKRMESWQQNSSMGGMKAQSGSC